MLLQAEQRCTVSQATFSISKQSSYRCLITITFWVAARSWQSSALRGCKCTPQNGSNKCMTAVFPALHMSVRRQRKRSATPEFLPCSSCFISFILIIRLIFHSDGLHFWEITKMFVFWAMPARQKRMIY